MTGAQIATIAQETVYDLQRLHNLMEVIISSYESETIALQNIEQTSYAGGVMERYLSIFVIALDLIISAEEKLSVCFEEGDRPSSTKK